MAVTVTKVRLFSPAFRAGIRRNDIITHINGEPFLDFIDYRYFLSSEQITLRIDRNGKFFEKQVFCPAEIDFGLTFLENKQRSCANHCMFCFIDQLPQGMRSSLYFKDDDWRMSFLMGNYVTLTNVSEKEFNRILNRKVSPLYISVHATDDSIRQELLGVKKSNILAQLKQLKEAGITFHLQAVLVNGLNDGAILEKTISDLYALYPYAASLALVPVGLTKYREELASLSPIDSCAAKEILAISKKWQEKCLAECGSRFVFASDELYIRANAPLPAYEEYEGFEQIEDGVGMVRSFLTETEEALSSYNGISSRYQAVSIACGVDMFPFLKELSQKIEEKTGLTIYVYPVENRFFGSSITVSGLITAKDLIQTLKEKQLGERLFITRSMLKETENVFLDGVTLKEICAILKTKVVPVCSDGDAFLSALLGKK